jgi:uncharacterized membrane-anchored protein
MRLHAPFSTLRIALLGFCLAGIAATVNAQGFGERIAWADGPVKGKLGSMAEVSVPAHCRFADAKGAKVFLEATQNPVSGDEMGVMLCADLARDSSSWFIVFEYDETGLVRDDEKSSLDAAAILQTLRRGNEAGNEVRRDRGWTELELVGWKRQPYYDSTTHNLTWSTMVREKGASEQFVNHSVRLLGRGGVMNADLVAGPEQFDAAVVSFDSILTGYDYVDGQRYSEWREGDRVAEFGLTALIAGGAGVAAAKLGLFGKAWKLILAVVIAAKKLIIFIVLGVAAFIKNLFKKRETQPSTGGT